MSNREENGCFRRVQRIWAHIRSNCSSAFHRMTRRRRVEAVRHDVDPVVMLHTSPVSTVEPPNNNWVDPWLRVSTRTPPRKRYHQDRSPDTLLQIKIALQEQEIKDILSEEIQRNVFKPEVEGDTVETAAAMNAKNQKCKPLKIERSYHE